MKYMGRMNVRSLFYGQLCFYLGLLICALLKPSGLTINQGISYYGVFRLTVLPYSIGLLGSAYFCLRFAYQLKDERQNLTKYTFTLIGLLICGVALTPDTFSRLFDDAHMTFGSILFIVQLLFSGWIVKQMNYYSWATVLALTELLAGIVSFIYLGPSRGYLLESQSVFQICFGLISIHCLPQLLARPEEERAEHKSLKHANI